MRGWGGRSGTSPVPPWALTVLAVLLAVVALSYDELPGWALACALLAPVTAGALLAARPLVSLGVCVAASLATALALGGSVPVWSVALGAALGVIAFLTGRRAPRPLPAPAVFAAGAVLDLPLSLVAGDVWAWATGLLTLTLTVVLPWTLGRSIRQQAELVAATAERARLQERARIAHDMHDTLGHELSLLALHAGALEMAPDLEERHREAAARLRAGAGSATERLAEIISVLRDDGPAPLRPGPEDVEDLVDRAVLAGVAVSLEWEGARRLPPVVDRAAYRVVQEGLTNAMKHAPGTAVRVRLATAHATTVVTVANALSPGPRRAFLPPSPRRAFLPPSPRREGGGGGGGGGGVGLIGLRERVRLAGGTFQAGVSGHTFEMTATLPHTEEP
ncbi:histidine kinase [Streptosporangium sp. NPDC051022]|uniref:sensor histidine kinase n=1 Tax=Streptosporangium sp. NPDC051022 TaxID=3155752 RepID=UPI003441971B